jgi:hypothetical protein
MNASLTGPRRLELLLVVVMVIIGARLLLLKVLLVAAAARAASSWGQVTGSPSPLVGSWHACSTALAASFLLLLLPTTNSAITF